MYDLDIQWTLRYLDARYPDPSNSVSGRFFWGTDFLNVIFSHLSGILRSRSRWSVVTTKCIFTLYFGSLVRTVDFDDRCLSTLVIIPELGLNSCKNTGLAYCFYKTTCDNVWPIVWNSLSVTCIDRPVIWIRKTYLIKLNAYLLDYEKNILNIL